MGIAILFPGQGAQQVGMGGALTARSARAKSLFDEASEILGFDLLDKCLNSEPAELNKTELCQPALFVHAFAALQQLFEEEPQLQSEVTCYAGLSLGEYTAVAAAGGCSFSDGVRLVQVRGRAMQAAADAVSSGMSSVLGLEPEKLEEVCQQATDDQHFVKVANLLCPGNTAVSGHISALERAEQISLERGAVRAIRLQVAGAFHTQIMEPAVSELEAALAQVEFSDLTVPVYSNVDAAPHTQGEDIAPLLARQVVSPVQWEASLREILASGVERCMEVGTGKVLAGTLKRIQRKFPCSNYGDS